LETVIWKLPSGDWTSSTDSGCLTFAPVAAGRAPATSLKKRQLASLGLADTYPPEFRFNPSTGEKLPEGTPIRLWVTPDGGRHINPKYSGFGVVDPAAVCSIAGVEGLETVPAPGNGQFEFIVGSFNTGREQLLAVNIKDYSLRILVEDEWVELQCESHFIPDGSGCSEGWRAELFEGAYEPSRLIVRTSSGLTRISIDASTLSFKCDDVTPKECRRVIGAPISWRDGILIPFVDHSNAICVAHLTDGLMMQSQLSPRGKELPVDYADIEFKGVFSRCDRTVFWIADTCVLQVNRSWGETFRLQRLPETYSTAFEAGRPHIDCNDSMWLAVRSSRGRAYISLGQVGDEFEVKESSRVIISSGKRLYRKDMIFENNDPWSEVVQNSDKTTSVHLYPLLEFFSVACGIRPDCALALRFDTGDAAVTWSAVYDDSDSDRSFSVVLGDKKLLTGKGRNLLNRARAFLCCGYLWFYSSNGTPLTRWKLSS